MIFNMDCRRWNKHNNDNNLKQTNIFSMDCRRWNKQTNKQTCSAATISISSLWLLFFFNFYCICSQRSIYLELTKRNIFPGSRKFASLVMWERHLSCNVNPCPTFPNCQTISKLIWIKSWDWELVDFTSKTLAVSSNTNRNTTLLRIIWWGWIRWLTCVWEVSDTNTNTKNIYKYKYKYKNIYKYKYKYKYRWWGWIRWLTCAWEVSHVLGWR